jgi:hypothetical protein
MQIPGGLAHQRGNRRGHRPVAHIMGVIHGGQAPGKGAGWWILNQPSCR